MHTINQLDHKHLVEAMRLMAQTVQKIEFLLSEPNGRRSSLPTVLQRDLALFLQDAEKTYARVNEVLSGQFVDV